MPPNPGSSAIVRFNEDATVNLEIGAQELGQGAFTVLAQMAAQTLGVPFESIRVVNGDTELMPWDVGVHASRTTFVAGNSARRAALKARDKLLASASDQLDRSAD